MARTGKKLPPEAGGLNIRARLFVQHYLIERNATKAAIEAGYSAKTAAQAGNRLLRNVQVQALIAQSEQKVAEKLDVTHEKIVAELARIGFADIRNVVQWGDGVLVKDPDTGKPIRVDNVVSLVSSASLDDEIAACISEISQTAQGLKVKMHDKRAALVDLGKHLGMFKEKVELSGPGGRPISISMNMAGKKK